MFKKILTFLFIILVLVFLHGYNYYKNINADTYNIQNIKISNINFIDRFDYENFEENYQGKTIKYWTSNGLRLAQFSAPAINFTKEDIDKLPVLYTKEKIPQYAHSFFPLNEIKYIVVHNTANPYADARDHYTYISTNEQANTSAHFYVDDVEVIQALPTNLQCWSVGSNENLIYQGITNANSINIEICETGNISKAITNAEYLIREVLLKYYPNALVVRHYDATLKACPRYITGKKWDLFLNNCYNGNIPENYYEQLNESKTY